MKKIAVTAVLVLSVMIAAPAYGWQYEAYETDSLGAVTYTYGVDITGRIGQNFVLQGERTDGGIQDIVLYVNLDWGEVMINHLINDYYYGSASVGFWEVPGSYQFTITNGGYDAGWSFIVGTPPQGAVKNDSFARKARRVNQQD